MGRETNISWTDSTPMVDRGGRRTRYYKRKNPLRPGTQKRREMRKLGLSWCRGCRDWLPQDLVYRQGVCRTHANEDYRMAYANGDREVIAERVHARQRNVAPVTREMALILTDTFGGLCAYECGRPATSWDHIIPVSKGGQTVRGNIVPACGSCNSRKRNRPVECMPIGHLLINEIVMGMV
jgi:5-methylcytosine-specific restriction endonuclease McrA